MRQEIRDRILARSDGAARCAAMVRDAIDPDREFVKECVHRYVCYKYSLEFEEARGLSMLKLAEMSLDKALELGIPFEKNAEQVTTCGMAGSAVMKIALLLKAAANDFNIKADPGTLGKVNSTEELGELVWKSLE